MNTQQNEISYKKIQQNKGKFAMMLLEEGFTKTEVREMIDFSATVITSEELTQYRNFEATPTSFKTVSLRGGIKGLNQKPMH